MGAAAVGMLVITLLIGQREGGAKAWIRLGGSSLQPSELAKICYIRGRGHARPPVQQAQLCGCSSA